jgi:chorismate--pyruvate lyase
MSVQNLQPASAIQWLSEPESPAQRLTPALRSWLTDTGLLTARMRSFCANNFRLEVLEDDATLATDTLRRVLLCCAELPCIYAETFLPATTRAAHPWLSGLGSEPLGEALQSRPDVSRGNFEFALLAPPQLPVEARASNASALWARRSVFTLGREPLTVTEIFLPGVIQCENRRVRHAADHSGTAF